MFPKTFHFVPKGFQCFLTRESFKFTLKIIHIFLPLKIYLILSADFPQEKYFAGKGFENEDISRLNYPELISQSKEFRKLDEI